ncbi:ATP/GTP-binding protein [Thermofilum pendens]|uniref:GTPase n=1 Tax=Thermofilum pendens (strain DSM 2475 / Hrk 5) TaxID=368408 RepID=A1RX50_THEPD|nr:ATP/GTP-binding protein [Thermofilum pendens]ABL77780.1 protein of unknown function, ATP binding [Thermofilum pendens Hrk 5]
MVKYLVVFIVGPAGSGKSTFTSSFKDWLLSQSTPASTINLDPAVEYLDYDPDIDIREYVFVRDVIEKYNLGPNGAIIASVDLAVEHLDKVQAAMEDLPEGYVLVDTPGQMEIFAYRQSGTYIVSELCSSSSLCAAVFMVDASIATQPYNFLSQLFLSASMYYRLRLPLTVAVNKIDVLEDMEKNRLLNWLSDVESMENELEFASNVDRVFTKRVLRLLSDFMEVVPFVPVSAKTKENFEQVYFYLQQIYRGGEDFERDASEL